MALLSWLRERSNIMWHQDGGDKYVCVMYLPYNVSHLFLEAEGGQGAVQGGGGVGELEVKRTRLSLSQSDEGELEVPALRFGDVLIIDNQRLFHCSPCGVAGERIWGGVNAGHLLRVSFT